MQKFREENVNIRRQELQHIIDVAMGRTPADLVLKNARYVNVFSEEILTADIAVAGRMIVGLGRYQGIREVDCGGSLVLPGLIDAHIHLESSLVVPSEFARAVLPHGTTTVVTDPHEIANVMGRDGIAYMLAATEGLPVDVRFMLPSCVPVTEYDESGASLAWEDLDSFYDNPRVLGLAEVMNFVGVIAGDSQVIDKLSAASLAGARIDGHAPDLSGNGLNAYIAAGARSDHECLDTEEAWAKIERGQFIMIREGTAARNLEALWPLLNTKANDRCLFCTDDKHLGDLKDRGHMDYIIKKAIDLGADPLAAIKAATINTARYFRLEDRGAIAPGYVADLVVIDSLESFKVQAVYSRGALAGSKGQAADFPMPEAALELVQKAEHTIRVGRLKAEDFRSQEDLKVIGMVNGELITTDEGWAREADVSRDILHAAVVERHKGTGRIGLGYIKGYGLKSGAVATTISHDSHNIIVVGTSEEECAAAVNRIVELKGGIVVWNEGRPAAEVPLAIAGLMSEEPLPVLEDKMKAAKATACNLGVNPGIDPFMTLSFMALPVIPQLRLTTRGVFDVENQRVY